MVLGLVLGLAIPIAAGVPTTVGVAEGVSYQRQQNESAKDDEKRMAKFQVEVYCEGGGEEVESNGSGRGKGKGKGKGEREVHGRRLGLRDGKVYVSTPTSTSTSTSPPTHTHPMTAFYVAYPDPDRPPTRGLVSTISDDPPLLNWIYVDRDTLELKYGNRTQSREHLVGPWDWTTDADGEGDGEGEGEGLVFEGWEGFVLVEEEEGVWGLRFDRGDDGLKGVVGVKGKRVLRVSLERKMVEGG